MDIERISDKDEIVKLSKDISVGDQLLVNRRKRYLEVEEKYQYYKDTNNIKGFFILRGNGTKYLFVIYEQSYPLIYTSSDFKLEEKDYTDGYGFRTKTKSSERVGRLFVSKTGHCNACGYSKIYDSDKDEFYCPIC